MERPYLQPVYDEPEFIVRTVWRLYGGWWDGNPATLSRPPSGRCRRAGRPGRWRRSAGRPGPGPGRRGPTPATRRSRDAGPTPPLRLAGHLAELAWLAAPDDPGVHGSPNGVHPPGRCRHVDHGPRGVFVGGTGVRDGGAAGHPDRPRAAPNSTPLNWEFAGPRQAVRSTSNCSGAH